MEPRIVGAVVACALAACGGNGGALEDATSGAEAPARADVRVVASEFDFVVEEPVAPGPARFVVRNEGKQLHHAIVYRLKPGVSVAEATQRLAEDDQGTGELAEHVGGSGPIQKGDEDWFGVGEPLQPGIHVLVCFLQDQRRSTAEKTHVELGMIQDFEVR